MNYTNDTQRLQELENKKLGVPSLCNELKLTADKLLEDYTKIKGGYSRAWTFTNNTQR